MNDNLPNNSITNPNLLGYLLVFLLSINIGLYLGKNNTKNLNSSVISGVQNYFPSRRINDIYNDSLYYTAEIHVNSCQLRNVPSPIFGFQPRLVNESSLGSGFVVSKDGYIITNAHVIKKAKSIEVTFSDKSVYPANKIGEDLFTDIAVIKVNKIFTKYASLGNSITAKPGDFVLAIGSPYGLSNSMSLGIISAKNRNIEYMRNHVKLIQTDASINQGNSGGPLINMEGNVIGVNTITALDRKLSFAIPIDVALESYHKIIKNGDVQRPYLGMYIDNFSNRQIRSTQLPNINATGGVIVKSVMPNGPAFKASIKPGDIIEGIDSQKVNNLLELRQIIQTHKPNDVITFQIRDNGQLVQKTLTLGLYPEF